MPVALNDRPLFQYFTLYQAASAIGWHRIRPVCCLEVYIVNTKCLAQTGFSCMRPKMVLNYS